ncbi:MAG: patatin family protein [Eubacteriales bacterium]|nr:patatin family protein [Eubacteriales bacterium]
MSQSRSKEAVKTGLVLEGGAMRGIYTAGVLDVLMDHGVGFDGVMGVSAGAIHGCSFVSGQKGRSIRYYKKYCKDKRFMSFHSLLRSGDLVEEKFCYHELPEKLDPYDYDSFNKSSTDFYVTCSNLVTGKPEYFKVKDMKEEIDLLRASASMPFVSRIVDFRGKKLLDGGCTDSIPVKAFYDLGYKKNVVVLTRHEGYEKKPEPTGLTKIFYRKYPAFGAAVKKRHIVYNQTLEEIRKMEQSGDIFVIRPSVELTISRMEHDPERIQEVYDIGHRDAEAAIQRLVKWLGRETDQI